MPCPSAVKVIIMRQQDCLRRIGHALVGRAPILFGCTGATISLLLVAMNREEEPVQNACFVDAHVHIKDVSGLDAVLAAGVRAVRDSGFRENTREGSRCAAAAKQGPVIVSARWAIYKKGGYGSAIGVPVESREEIASEIIRLAGAGAGIIKVMASGMVSLREPGEITSGGFSRDELRFIVETARTKGLEVMAHANGEAAIVNAAEAGVRSVEHGFFMTDRALESLRRNGVFWVPTVVALQRAAEQTDVGQEVKRFVERTIDEHLAMLRTAFERGVPLAVGTDAVLPDCRYRSVYEAELAFFRRSGIPGDAVLTIAGDGGKKLLGIK
jgi:imidazolonepropionase-like amidohydrolase